MVLRESCYMLRTYYLRYLLGETRKMKFVVGKFECNSMAWSSMSNRVIGIGLPNRRSRECRWTGKKQLSEIWGAIFQSKGALREMSRANQHGVVETAEVFRSPRGAEVPRRLKPKIYCTIIRFTAMCRAEHWPGQETWNTSMHNGSTNAKLLFKF